MQPIRRLLIVLLLAGIICEGSFFLFTKEIQKYEVHNTARLNELLLGHTHYDLVFLGSSRTHFDINPRIIDSICGLKSFNAGVEGGNLYEFEMMLKAYLENHPAPRYIVLNLDLHSFIGGSAIFNYPVYFPYTGNKVIRDYLWENGHLNTIKRILPFFKFTDYDDNTKGFFLQGLTGKTEIAPGNFQYKGYLSNTDVTINDIAEPPAARYEMEISNAKKQILARIIERCHKENIELVFTYLPEYKKEYEQSITNCDTFFATVDSFITNDHILFIRDDQLDINNNPLLFANVSHLNKAGAQEYSVILAKELRTDLHLQAH